MAFREPVAHPAQLAEEIMRVAVGGRLTLFLGAFLSVRAPSSLPLAGDLKRAIFMVLWRALEERSDRILHDSPERLLLESGWQEVPLEMLMEGVLHATGMEPRHLLSFLGEAHPNHNHAVVASLLDHALATVVTTNFDELIEVSRHAEGDASGLIKPHGTFSQPDEMTVRLRQVGRKVVSRQMRNRLTRAFRGRDLCFVGYSGRDLDIRPIFKGEEIRSVLWVLQPAGEGRTAADLEVEKRRVKALFDARTDVNCVAIDADLIFDELGRMLSVPRKQVERAEAWRGQLEAGLLGLSWEHQADALARALAYSGCHEPAARIYREIEAADIPPSRQAKATLKKASMQYRQQRFDEARSAAQRAVRTFRRIEQAQDLARGYQLLSQISERSAETDNGWAIRYLERAISLYDSQSSPDAVGARLDLGIWLKNRGRYAQAERTLLRALREARVWGDLPGQMSLRLSLGILKGTERHDALAAGEMVRGQRLARSARYYLRRAREAAAFLALTADELRCLTALIALDLDRSQTRPRWKSAGALLDEAERLALRSPELDQRWNIACMRGDWLNQQGRSAEAIALLTEAVDNAGRVPFLFAALRERGLALLNIGMHREAEADLERAVQLAPAGPHRRSADEVLQQAKKSSSC